MNEDLATVTAERDELAAKLAALRQHLGEPRKMVTEVELGRAVLAAWHAWVDEHSDDLGPRLSSLPCSPWEALSNLERNAYKEIGAGVYRAFVGPCERCDRLLRGWLEMLPPTQDDRPGLQRRMEDMTARWVARQPGATFSVWYSTGDGSGRCSIGLSTLPAAQEYARKVQREGAEAVEVMVQSGWLPLSDGDDEEGSADA